MQQLGGETAVLRLGALSQRRGSRRAHGSGSAFVCEQLHQPGDTLPAGDLPQGPHAVDGHLLAFVAEAGCQGLQGARVAEDAQRRGGSDAHLVDGVEESHQHRGEAARVCELGQPGDGRGAGAGVLVLGELDEQVHLVFHVLPFRGFQAAIMQHGRPSGETQGKQCAEQQAIPAQKAPGARLPPLAQRRCARIAGRGRLAQRERSSLTH